MLMGQLPGSLPGTNLNGYTGAQRFVGAPLQPYPMPRPVPRPPVAPPPPPPPLPGAALPAAIEAWRAQLLAMHPFLASRQFGIPIGQMRQLLADPLVATQLYLQTHKQNMPRIGVPRGGEGGNSDVAGQRAVDSLRAGMADLTLGNVASALNLGSRILSMEGLLGLGLQGLGHTMFPGWIDSPLPNFTGQIDIGDIVAKNPDIAAAIKDMQLDPNPTSARHKQARIRGMIEKAVAQKGKLIEDARKYGEQAVAKQGAAPTGIANSGGMGRPGTPGAPRSTGGVRSGGAVRSGGGNGGQGRSSSAGAGPGGRGPRGGGAYGGMGGVGSHGV